MAPAIAGGETASVEAAGEIGDGSGARVFAGFIVGALSASAEPKEGWVSRSLQRRAV